MNLLLARWSQLPAAAAAAWITLTAVSAGWGQPPAPPSDKALRGLETARRMDAAQRPAEAERAASEALGADPQLAEAYYYRGRARFCLDRMDEAVRDFDRYVELRPRAASQQWERGIACYYAGRYQAGADQFRLYQTYHDNDVENSVWRFLCMARTAGFEAARRDMLPIRDDRRVPMMEVYRLFRGEASPQQVLDAVGQGDPSPAQLRGRLFYARLYVGLYYEALGDSEQARRNLRLAAGEHSPADPINGFMWRVADIHWRRLQAAGQPEKDDAPPTPSP